MTSCFIYEYSHVFNVSGGNLETTFVGSFPLEYSRENILRVVKDILDINLTFPNYPQLQDFVKQFLDPIVKLEVGLVKRNGDFWLEGDLSIPNKPVGEEPLRIMMDYLKRNRETSSRLKGVRACVTGPFTLSSRVFERRDKVFLEFDNTILRRHEKVFEMAEVVSRIAEHFSKIGATYVNIDEPLLSIMVGAKKTLYNYRENEIIEIIETSLKRVKGLKGIHVCGIISPKLKNILLRTNLDVLDHEFKDTPKNLEIFKREDFNDTEKKLSLGCISSKIPRIESVDEVKGFVMKAMETYGPENIAFIKPDCGFRGLIRFQGIQNPYKVSIDKLKVLTKVHSLI